MNSDIDQNQAGGGAQIDVEHVQKVLDEDTFSVMMTSKIRSSGWALGIFTFLFQLIIVSILLHLKWDASTDSEGRDSVPFGAPIRTDIGTTIGQFLAILLMLFSQRDALSAFEFLVLFRSCEPNKREGSFYVLLVEDDEEKLLTPQSNKAPWSKWFFRAILPNILKLIQGILVFIVTILEVIQADNLFQVLTGYAALYFVSEIDNQVFSVAKRGFFGRPVMLRAHRVLDIKVKPHAPPSQAPRIWPETIMVVIFFMLAAPLIGGLSVVKLRQRSGEFTKLKYPNCTDITGITGEPMDEADYLKKIQDDHCDGWLNTAECGFDGEDCNQFNLEHPQCPVLDTELLGNGFCNGGFYATIGCNKDDGDCEECPFVPTSEKNTTALATADFDGDGWIDVVVGNCWLSNQILWNNGNGIFTQDYITELSSRLADGYDQCTVAIAAADLNDDGLVDIVVARALHKSYISTNVILWNNGDRTAFTEQVLPGSGEINSRAVQLVDLNNDTLPEIIFGNAKGYNSTIFWNNGNKNFDEMAMPRTVNSETDYSSNEMYDTTSILAVAALRDLSYDDFYKNNIYFGNYNQINMKYLGGKYIDGRFKEFNLVNDNLSPTKTVSIVRLPVKELSVDESLSILYLNDDGNHESDSLSFATNVEMKEARVIDVANMDNDGLEELVAAGDYGVSNRVFFLFDGNVPTIKSSIELPCTLAMNTKAIALADFDKDGNIDVIMGNSMQRNQLLLNFLGDGKTYKQPGDDPNSIWLPEISVGYKYPDCKKIVDSDSAWMLLNGECNNYNSQLLNTKECGYDGGECDNFNEFMNKHPGCDGGEVRANWIGDGTCNDNNLYNIEECGWDGGDCEDYFENYPNCNSYSVLEIGNGFCNSRLNTVECGFDGGDCDEFNAQYPDCVVDDQDQISMLNDTKCDGKYNTEACKFDGGDCIEFNNRYPLCKVDEPSQVGDGKCNDKPYNSGDCNFDDGDCIEFNEKYPSCNLEDTFFQPYMIGDGRCNTPESPVFSQECGWDGGDCSYIIDDQSSFDTLTAANLTDLYNRGIKEFEVTTANGAWKQEINLPNGVPEGSKFRITCNSDFPVDVVYNHVYCTRQMRKTLVRNENLSLVVVGENWYEEDGPIVYYRSMCP